PAALPFAVEGLRRHGREAVLGAAAAAPGGADEELPAEPRDVDGLAVGADDDVAPARGRRPAAHRDAGGDGTWAAPMRASRVIRGTSCASSRFSERGGRSGRTM